ncbi:MAG: hypothetical protein GY870_21855 [archaeon]|nr:hypothetical protein [archaeon]
MGSYNLNFWSEFTKYKYIIPVISKMGEYNIGLFQSIDEKRMNDFQMIYDTCLKNDVSLSIWPLLKESEGYWLSASNIHLSLKLIKKIIDRYPKINLIALDFELPRNLGMINSKIAGMKSRRFKDRIQNQLDNLVKTIQGYGIKVFETTGPIFPEFYKKMGIIQCSNADYYSAMIYTSYFRSSFLKNLISEQNCESFVYDMAQNFNKKYGKKAALDLGRISYGVNRNMHFPLHNIIQIKKEISCALAGGVKNLQLFALDDNIFHYRGRYDELFGGVIDCKPKLPSKNYGVIKTIHQKMI